MDQQKGGRESIIAQGTSFKGTVSSDCPITVSGVLDGELAAPALVVTDSGSVHGKVKVEDVKSSGEISGEIDAGAMQLSGRVRENTSIRAKTLEVRLASTGSEKLQITFGNASIEVGPDPQTAKKPKPPDVIA